MSGVLNTVDDYLRARNWETVRENSDELFTKYGLELPDRDSAPFGEVLYFKATLAPPK